MANLPESPSYDQGVYQLETTDPVIGGPNGVSNAPLRNLANRTAFLKQKADQLDSQKAPKESPEFTGNISLKFPASVDFSKATTVKVSTPTAYANNTEAVNVGYTKQHLAPKTHVGSGGDAHAVATTNSAGFMSAEDKQKLDGISAGAGTGGVSSVAGRTGAVTLTVSDVSGALGSSHAGTGGSAHALATTYSHGFMSAQDKQKLNGLSSGGVTSVNGQSGAVTISRTSLGAAPVDSPTFTGTPKSTKAGETDRSSKIATTEWVVDHALRAIYHHKLPFLDLYQTKNHMGCEILGMFGVRIQAGNTVINAGARFNFPQAFPKKCHAVIVCDGGAAAIALSAHAIDKNGFTLRPPQGVSGIGIAVNWIAIGF